ncbi:general secretion pathway protein A [Syntrophus gentianae]|uniref:General secretion pathway protein A n=1 Tax=Syntrophus gentianae TaxID=43775 RepID=A0A1H7Y9I9_9BACT|nr:AAA family ATPase [Syntrophus gentianae]SEM42790.1 general secretion pathway protein A [Syntrophus gentianae]
MYESFYGLKENPFNLTPDPSYLFMSKVHEDAYTHLEYAIVESKGFVVITGEIGSGKTTLINLLLNKIKQNIQVGVINQTLVSPTQFLKMVCQEFELPTDSRDKAELLDLIHSFLLKQFARKKRVTLIIDEAQNLPDNTVEEIRMLSNLESEKHHLIQMILVGQPELKYKLQQKRLEQFVQRVTVYCHLSGLDRDETAHYIRHRLSIAGSENPELFTEEAIDAIHRYARGIPRLINILCDAALVYGYADELRAIDKIVIEDVIAERKIGGIFPEQDAEREADLPLMPEYGQIRTSGMEQQFTSIESRLQLLESLVADINTRLGVLFDRKEQQDERVLQLLKMLKESNESRVALMAEIAALKGQPSN